MATETITRCRIRCDRCLDVLVHSAATETDGENLAVSLRGAERRGLEIVCVTCQRKELAAHAFAAGDAAAWMLDEATNGRR